MIQLNSIPVKYEINTEWFYVMGVASCYCEIGTVGGYLPSQKKSLVVWNPRCHVITTGVYPHRVGYVVRKERGIVLSHGSKLTSM